MKLINQSENINYIIDYYYADKLLKIFTFLWILYVIFCFHENQQRAEILHEPIIWIQKVFNYNKYECYIFTIISMFFCLICILNNNILPRLILFLCIMYLNAVKWHYNVFSHVGHLLLLAHFTTIFIPRIKFTEHLSKKAKKEYSYAIRWALAGILATYTLAGIWKFLSLFYKIIKHPNEVHWLHPYAVELNAIVSARYWDETISEKMLRIYEIPYIWEFGTIFIFFIEFIAIAASFRKNISYFIVTSIIIFHIYNIIFINTSFYVSSFVLLILFFPYHKLIQKKEN